MRASASLVLKPVLGTLFLLLGFSCVSNFNRIVSVSSYYILFFDVWLLSLRSLFLSLMRDRNGVDPEGKSRIGGNGETRGVGNYNQYTFYHKIIYFQ